jgi:hypothetical protein
METPIPNEAQRRRLKLVLPKSFFDQTFLILPDATAHAFKVANCYHFIVNLVIEVTSCLPENSLMAATTEKAWAEFSRAIEKREYALGGKELLAIFKNMIVVVPTENWGPLSDHEAVIALADRLYATSSLDPMIVTNEDSVQNYREAAATYYGKEPKRMDPLEIPFKIYDPVETKAHLQAIFQVEATDVLKKTLPPYNVF